METVLRRFIRPVQTHLGGNLISLWNLQRPHPAARCPAVLRGVETPVGGVYLPPDGNWMPVRGIHIPPRGVWMSSGGFHTPVNDIHIPSDGIYTPARGIHMPSDGIYTPA